MTFAEPSIKSLFLEMRFDGQVLASGSGFLVQNERHVFLVTNRHNVTGRNNETEEVISKTCGTPNEIVISHNRQGQPGISIEKVEPLFVDGTPRWFEHPNLGAAADFVALPVVQLADVAVHPYNMDSLGPEMFLAPSDVVSVVGFPFGLRGGGSFAVWATGFIASEPNIDFNGRPVFLIDCRTREGQSGSAVIAYRSAGVVAEKIGTLTVHEEPVTRFLGIYSGRINKDSDIGIVWKAEAIRELIESVPANVGSAVTAGQI